VLTPAKNNTDAKPPGPVDLRDIGNWWTFVKGAD